MLIQAVLMLLLYGPDNCLFGTELSIFMLINLQGIEVVYVDYGNTEVLPVTNLREPTQENAHVMSLPFQVSFP